MATVDEKRKTLTNDSMEIRDARVIANYGDPGLDEDYQFDILSRYVIVMFESCDRVLTADRWWRMLAVVQRPKSLWINVVGGVTTPSSQQRSDALGNINAGSASSYSLNGIPRMNNPYQLGDTIKVRKISEKQTTSIGSILLSQFTEWDANTFNYGSWHNQGSTLPYFAGNNTLLNQLLVKTLIPVGNGYYNFNLTKAQYEAFALTINNGNNPVINVLTSIFGGQWGGNTQVYNANGGYIFNSQNLLQMAMVEYEDINADGKERVANNSCIPLVVATPNSFPTPKSRGLGTINYTPTYVTIQKSN